MKGLNATTDSVRVAIVGSGHAGLAVSYCLAQLCVPHVVFERGRIGESWRSKRWDSFALVTPRSAISLPGEPYCGPDPHGYMSAGEFVEFLAGYARSFSAPVREGVNISAIEANPSGGFFLRTDDGVVAAEQVVVATGGCQLAKLSAFSSDIAPEIHQLTAEQYRSPANLADGAVLVVGSGQSGAQIAEELNEHQRKVFLCVGSSDRWPRRYRGRDIISWLIELDDVTVDTLGRPAPQYDRNGHVSGRNGGHNIHLRRLARNGVTLLGRLSGINGDQLLLDDGLEDTLKEIDERERMLKQRIDILVRNRGLTCPDEDMSADLPPLAQPFDQYPTQLNSRAEGINTIIWAIGYRLNFDWVKLPVFDDQGTPIHYRGVTKQQGLYFIGLPWLYRPSSSGLTGIREDAAHLAHQVVRLYKNKKV